MIVLNEKEYRNEIRKKNNLRRALGYKYIDILMQQRSQRQVIKEKEEKWNTTIKGHQKSYMMNRSQSEHFGVSEETGWEEEVADGSEWVWGGSWAAIGVTGRGVTARPPTAWLAVE